MHKKISPELKIIVVAAFLLFALVTAAFVVQLTGQQTDALTFIYNSTH